MKVYEHGESRNQSSEGHGNPGNIFRITAFLSASLLAATLFGAAGNQIPPGVTIRPDAPGACAPLSSPSQLTVDGSLCGELISTAIGQPSLAWSNVDFNQGYAWELYDGAGCTGNLVTSGTTGPNITSAIPASALPNGAYSWRVAATGDGTNYCDSPWICACPFTECTALPAPTALTVSPGAPGALQLNWAAVTGATAYNIYISKTGCQGGFSYYGQTASNSLTVPNLCPGGLDMFKVTAVGSCESPPSSCKGEVPEGTCRGKIWESDFDDVSFPGFTDWTAGGTWQKSGGAHSGAYSAWSGNVVSQDDTLVSVGPINIQPGYSATLSFWSAVSLETNYDYGVVEIARGPHYRAWEGLTTTMGQSIWTNVSGWTHYAIDLSAYAGLTVQIRFRIHTDYAAAWGGWSVDDVKVGSCGPTWVGLKQSGVSAATCDQLTQIFPDAVNDACSGSVTYNAYRAVDPNSPWTMLSSCGTPTTASPFLDNTAEPGSLQYYRVRASATSNPGGPCSLGVEETNSRTVSSFVPPFTTYFSDSFEGGFAGPWVATGGWNIASGDYWADGANMAHSGNLPSQDDTLTTASPIRLPDGVRPWLFLLSRHDTEPSYDYGLVQVANGPAFTAWTTLLPDGGAPATGTSYFWGRAMDLREVRYDLSAYAGQRIKIRFYYHSDWSNSYGGWWLDRVRLVATGPSFAGLKQVNGLPAACGAVRLDWTAASTACAGGPIRYHVYRSTDPAFMPGEANRITVCPGVAATNYVDATAAPDTQYYYVVRSEQQTGATGPGPCAGVMDENTVRHAGSAQPESILFQDPFEGDGLSAMWQANGGWNLSTLDALRGSASAHSGSLAYQDDTMTLGRSFRVPPGGSTRMTFWSIVDSEVNFDVGRVEVSVAPTFDAWSAVTPVPTSPVTGDNRFTGVATAWRQYTVDLAPWAGNDVKIRFNWHSDWNITGLGWFLDDIKVINTQVTFAGVESVRPDASCNSLELTWSPAVLPCTGTVHYNIYRSPTAPFTPSGANRITNCVAPPTGSRFVDTPLVPATNYYYIVRAEREGVAGSGPCGGDEDNNVAVRVSTVAGDEGLLLAEHFESGLGQWAATGNWAASTASARSLTASAFSGNQLNQDALLSLIAPITPTPYSSLSFFSQWNLETGSDYGRVQLYDPGIPGWVDLTLSEVETGALVTTFTGPQTKWREYRASLGAYAGQSVSLRLSYHTDWSVQWGGWFVDDVKVTGQPLGCGQSVCLAAPAFAGAQTAVPNPNSSACGIVRLGWTLGTPGCAAVELHYNIYRSTVAGVLGQRISSCSTYGASFDDSPPGPGTYYYTVRAEDSAASGSGPCGGNEETNLVQRTVNFITLCPGAVLAADNLCRKEVFQFRDASSGGTPAYTHSWAFGDGVGTSTLAAPGYAYAASGPFSVTQQVWDSLAANGTTTLPVTVADCVWGTLRNLRISKNGSGRAALTWTAPSGTAPLSYNIYLSPSPALPSGWPGSFTLAANVTAPTLTWTDVATPAGTTMHYFIIAVNTLNQEGDR